MGGLRGMLALGDLHLGLEDVALCTGFCGGVCFAYVALAMVGPAGVGVALV